MFDKLEKHNNKKFAYVVNRRIGAIKNAVLSFFNVNKGEEKYNFNNYYYFSTKK
jgi:hypothetical protein